MSVDPKYFTPEHFAHPERWTYRGHPVAWIAQCPVGEATIAIKYEKHYTKEVYYGDCFTSPGDVELIYTAPDPWEGVEIEVTAGMRYGQVYVDVIHQQGLGEPKRGEVAKRRFRLVPVEDSK